MEVTTGSYAVGNLWPMAKKPQPSWKNTPRSQRRPIYLREWRLARGMTGEKLAELLETTKATISRIENREDPASVDFLQAAADVLGCHHSDLIKRPPTAAEHGPVALTQEPAQRRQSPKRASR